MLYRFISQLTYTGFLRQELMLRHWYFYSEEHGYLSVGSASETTVLFPWTNSEKNMSRGFGYNLLDAYYTLTGDMYYVEFGEKSYEEILNILVWLRSGMAMGE